MGFWPFGKGKKSRLTGPEEKSRDIAESPSNTIMSRKEKVPEPASRTVSRTDSKYDGYERSRKPSRTPSAPGARTASFLPPPRSQTAQAGTPAKSGIDRDSTSRPAKLQKQNLYHHNPTSNSSLGPENFSVIRPPTLRARREDYDPSLPRRKSSKRKVEDYAREREIRAMSSPIPIPKRPNPYSGGPLRKETKQVPGDLNKRFSRPTSEVSLPLPESFSEAEDLSTQNSFKISMLAALSPRPTVRYDSKPHIASGKRPAPAKISIQQIIQEEDPFSKRRIDDLADDLGSGDLRDLLERDKKRRDRKRDADKNKLHRKLQRRADKQREDELNRGRADEADPSTPGKAGLEIASDLPSSPPTVETTAQTDSSPLADDDREKAFQSADPFADPEPNKKTQAPVVPIRNPFEDEKDLEADQDILDHPEDEEPPIPVKSPLRDIQPVVVKSGPTQPQPSQATLSPPTSPLQQPVDRASFSQASMLARETTPDVPERSEIDRRASDQSGQYLSSWTTFFRKGGRRKRSSTDRGKTTPSEFSNTSRESFSRQQPPPIVPPRSFRRSESGQPQRTMSKFREDLPELPMSPPDSRVQSPEAFAIPTGAALPQLASTQLGQSRSGAIDSKSFATSPSIATLDQNRQKQSVELDNAEAGPSAAVLSQSLASVDSEGSWLSGKPAKRSSGPMISPLRESQSSLRPHPPGDFEQSEEIDDITTDEYLHRLAAAPEESRESSSSAIRRASSNVIDLRKERGESPEPEVPPIPDQADETWHGSIGRQATIVRQARAAKSKEGLLNEFKADDSDGASTDDDESYHEVVTPGDEYKAAPIMRATSVEYKGHARHISAGSARLLDIRRSSVQSEGIGAEKSTERLSRGPSVLKREEAAKAEEEL